MVPEELGSYTSLRISSLEQRMSVHYSGSLKLLIFNLQQLNDDACLIQNIKLKEISKKGSVTQAITVFQVSMEFEKPRKILLKIVNSQKMLLLR